MFKISRVFWPVLLCSSILLAANSKITIQGTGTSSTSAHISVTTNAQLCPDEYDVESGASLTTWDPSAICSATTEGDGDISLPVELSIFDAVAEEDLIRLEWSTQSEVNNLGFLIRRAPLEQGPYRDIASYQQHPDLIGAGNASARNDYSYADHDVDDGQTYWYKLVDVDFNGVMEEHGPISATLGGEDIPDDFDLYPNYPNPFNPRTTIRYDLVASGEVSLRIFDLQGRLVRQLLAGRQDAGRYQLTWDGANDHGGAVASGAYFYQLVISGPEPSALPDGHTSKFANAGNLFVRSRKMLLIR